VRGLPPGRYFVAAVDSFRDDESQDPDVLESLVGVATAVTVSEGSKVSVAPRLTRR
jgi:hypothetical protein